MGAAIKNAGNPGRRFLVALPLVLTASPLCALALKLLKKLLKLPSYAGWSYYEERTFLLDIPDTSKQINF